MSQDLLDTGVHAVDPRPAHTDAPPAPVAHPPVPTDQPLATRAPEGAEASAPPARYSSPGEQTLDWCDVCRFWRASPCDQCPLRLAPPEP